EQSAKSNSASLETVGTGKKQRQEWQGLILKHDRHEFVVEAAAPKQSKRPDLSEAEYVGACNDLGIKLPIDFGCPQCGANPGTRCKRPSGHEASAHHKDRWDLAGGKKLSDTEFQRIHDYVASEKSAGRKATLVDDRPSFRHTPGSTHQPSEIVESQTEAGFPEWRFKHGSTQFHSRVCQNQGGQYLAGGYVDGHHDVIPKYNRSSLKSATNAAKAWIERKHADVLGSIERCSLGKCHCVDGDWSGQVELVQYGDRLLIKGLQERSAFDERSSV